MVNIVLLTNQERLIRLFSGSGMQNAGKVRVANGIDEALSAISPLRQNLICIQERLGEMSGELLAYRIGAELKGKKATIVLFGDPETIPLSGRKPFHAVLDTTLSDAELTSAILEILSAPAVRTRKKKGAAKGKVQPQEVERKPAESWTPVLTDTIDDVVKIQGPSSFREVASSRREPSPSPDLLKTPFQVKLESALEEANGAGVAPGPERSPLSAEPFAGPLRVSWGKPSLLSRIRDRFLRPKLLMVLGVVFACFIALVILLIFYQQKPDRRAAAPGTSSLKAGTEASRPFQNIPGALPSFLPHQAADRDYGKANPGWERYQGPVTEFRIFREKGLIRALQIIDRGGQGISPGLLSSVLTEIAGSRLYVVETTEQKGTYQVEKGSVLTGGRIIVYRKVPEQSVKAFVLDLK
ncbi:MAG: hypothetical protein EG828_13410 [Deltaproteobacteria bacterium]|nr:hypothetical protein [Deltaproteobacteria bacterium]